MSKIEDLKNLTAKVDKGILNLNPYLKDDNEWYKFSFWVKKNGDDAVVSQLQMEKK